MVDLRYRQRKIGAREVAFDGFVFFRRAFAAFAFFQS
jgi:hypothetical protein